MNGLKLIAFAALFALFPALASAETVIAEDLVIEAPWARASIGTSRPGVAFMTIRNRGSVADVLTGIETPVSGRAQVHRSQMSNGVVSMAPAGPIEIPAGGVVRLAPGGLHAMLMMLSRPLVKGKTFPLILVFEKTGRVKITVPVLGVGARGPQE